MNIANEKVQTEENVPNNVRFLVLTLGTMMDKPLYAFFAYSMKLVVPPLPG